MDMSGSNVQVQVISTAEEFTLLQAEWDDLYERAEAPRLSQSFEWLRYVWETLALPAGGRLFCIAIRRSGRLVLAWPMVIARHKRLWTVATSLGSPEDYAADMLVDHSLGRTELAAAAWQTLCDRCRADFVHLERVRTDSLLHHVLAEGGARTVAIQPSPFLNWDRYEDWHAYWKSRGKTFPSNVDRKHRRLSEFGELSFEIATDPQRYREMVEWTFRRKEEWLVRKGMTYSSSVGSARYMSFLTNASSRVNTFGQVIGFALLLDDKIIATQISLLNPHMTENIHIAYDFAYARFSPGLLLDRYVLQWAFERGIAYDFHFGTDDRKRALGNANCDVVTSNYYRTAWAWVYEYLRLCRSAQLVRRLRRWWFSPRRCEQPPGTETTRLGRWFICRLQLVYSHKSRAVRSL